MNRKYKKGDKITFHNKIGTAKFYWTIVDFDKEYYYIQSPFCTVIDSFNKERTEKTTRLVTKAEEILCCRISRKLNEKL